MPRQKTVIKKIQGPLLRPLKFNLQRYSKRHQTLEKTAGEMEKPWIQQLKTSFSLFSWSFSPTVSMPHQNQNSGRATEKLQRLSFVCLRLELE